MNKAIAEQEVLIKILITQQRQEEDDDLGSNNSLLKGRPEGTFGYLNFPVCQYLLFFFAGETKTI